MTIGLCDCYSYQMKCKIQGMQKVAQCDESSGKTSPSSSTIRNLRSRRSYNGTNSQQSQNSNFCCTIRNSNYTVDRGYINTMGDNQHVQLYYTKFTPNVKRAQLCIIHSFEENSDDYLNMAEYFAERGYIVSMVDLRGRGYSGGERVNQPASKIATDIEVLLRNCQKDLKTFIIAHGLGSLFLNALLQQNPNLELTGIINISPILHYEPLQTPRVLRRLLLLTFPHIFSQLILCPPTNPTALSRDPISIKQKIDRSFWQNSPLTLRMVDQYEKVGCKVMDEAYKFHYPVFFVIGGRDFLENGGNVRKYYDRISSEDKEIRVIQGAYHEMHNDFEADQVLVRIYSWMESKKDGKKWKKPDPFRKDAVFRKSRLQFWAKFVLLIGFLIAMIKLAKKFKSLKILNSFLKK